MVLLESVSEIVAGVAVEVGLLVMVAGVVYRFLSGRFLIPKREMVLPNQRGVIVEGDRIVRIAEPGTAWVRPKQHIILCDMRVRPIQLAGVEVIGADNGIVRVSLTVEYRIADAGVYYTRSTNANDALFVQVRRALIVTARQHASANIVLAPSSFATALLDALSPEAARLGFEVTDLQVVEAISLGWLRHAGGNLPGPEDISGALVH